MLLFGLLRKGGEIIDLLGRLRGGIDVRRRAARLLPGQPAEGRPDSGPGLAHGGTAFTSVAHGVWWMIPVLGTSILALAAVSSSPWARGTAERTGQFTSLHRPITQ